VIDLGGAIKNALESDAEILAVTGAEKVHRLKAPEGIESPYITFFEVVNDDGNYADNEPLSVSLVYQVDVWCDASHVSKLLPLASGAERVMKAQGFSRLDAAEFYEKDTKLYHKAARYRISKDYE
jgi:hypothetical protein